ncbi:MAG: HAD-IC family P-type ATPase [Candidatus Moraniibacteriota bacterium]
MKNRERLNKVVWHNLPLNEITKELEVDFNKGLTKKEVAARRKKYGVNKIAKEKKFSKIKVFISQFNNPLIYILIAAAGVTLLMGKWTDGLVISLAVIVNTFFGYWEEVKVSKIFKKLHLALKTKAIVYRNGHKKEIFQKDLVVGDVIELKTGNKVPADARALEVENLQVSEAILTGESAPSQKTSEPLPEDTNLAERENMVYLGSMVESGNGKAVVVAVGDDTKTGNIATILRETKEEKSPLQKKMASFGRIIGLVIGGLSIVLFLGGLLRGDDILQTFEAAVAIAVGGVPESLPVVMTVVLAIGVERLLRKKGLVRKINSVETLGSTSVICLDKTKTLTQGKMELDKLVAEDKSLALKTAVLCNEAYAENPEDEPGNWKVNGSPTDKALFFAGKKEGIFKHKLSKKSKEILKLEFSFGNKFQASLREEEGKYFIYVTGAPEEVLKRSKDAEDEKHLSEELAQKGLRVVALARKEVKEPASNKERLEKEIKELEFVGLVGFKDPLRPDIPASIKKAREAGVMPVIITGDQRKTAQFVAREAGIEFKENQVIEGKDLEKMSEEELAENVDKYRIYARTEPEHKIRIVSAWQKKGEVVAMVGDGVNDAPAIKKADIGLSLGSGTEIAKEASDLVLLNDSFDIIVKAIGEGRTILDNIRKAIAYILSDSFASIIIVGAARIVFGWPLPILPVQILWNNFIEDTLPTISYAFEPAEKDVMKRKAEPKNISLLTKKIKTLIFFTGIIKQFIILFLFWLFWSVAGWDLDYVRTLMFGAFALDTAFVVFSFKNLHKNIWQINPFSNKWLNWSSLFAIIAFVSTIYVPFLQNLIKTVPLDLKGWLILAAVATTSVVLVELTKWIFIVKSQNKER